MSTKDKTENIKKLFKNPEGFYLIKKNGYNPNESLLGEKPTNVEGHYPRFMLPGAVNLISQDTREMSVILESFLPQLEKIGIKLKDINNLIREIILSTEVFRRLRGISQIELLPFAFKQVPWFTRFTHSCLTYVFAEHVLDKLNSYLKLSDVEIEAAKLCFLIHDLGHGPFSHLTERAFRVPRGKRGKTPKEYDHEYWTKILLYELQESLFEAYENPYKTKTSLKAEKLPHGSLKKSKEYNLEIFSKALSIITSENYFIVSQLLSGQIDLDRLSNYIGDRLIVSSVLEEYGIKNEGLVKYLSTNEETIENIKKIINHFVILNKNLEGKKCNEYLGIHEDAAHAVIHFFLDRHIIRYYLLKHYRREGANNILEKMLLRAQSLVRNNQLHILGKTDSLISTWLSGKHTETDLIKLDDRLVYNQIKRWAKHSKDPIIKDLALRFTANKFFSTYVVEKDGKPEAPNKAFLETIKEKIKNSISINGISKELIEEYYFTYDETTSSPYHIDRDEVVIYTTDKKIKKLSDYILETDNKLGKILLESKFERYLIIVPGEIDFS